MPTITSTDPNNEAKCANCGSTMTFTNDEVRAGDPIPGNEDGEHYGVIICANPKCKKPVRVRRIVSREQAQRERRNGNY